MVGFYDRGESEMWDDDLDGQFTTDCTNARERFLCRGRSNLTERLRRVAERSEYYPTRPPSTNSRGEGSGGGSESDDDDNDDTRGRRAVAPGFEMSPLSQSKFYVRV